MHRCAVRPPGRPTLTGGRLSLGARAMIVVIIIKLLLIIIIVDNNRHKNNDNSDIASESLADCASAR